MNIPPPTRRRKQRPYAVPADTLLTFSRYNPPPQPRRDRDRDRQLQRPQPTRRREAFVQANYRFAVSPTYTEGFEAVAALRDASVPWDSIDVVFVQRTSDCPICLESLRCACVTPCGHTFDHVCMLQHMSYAGAEGTKCPLCATVIKAEDLKLAAFLDVQNVSVGSCLDMSLLSREKASMIPGVHGRPRSGIPTGVNGSERLFARVGFADKAYLLELVKQDMKDLREVLKEDESLAPFVESAMKDLKQMRDAVRSRRNMVEETPQAVECGFASDLWFFYQASDCQNVFLHPCNHRCLSTEYGGNFNEASTDFAGLVLEINRHTMDETLRKRYRFLEHLPDGCEFSFVELDLSHILSAETVAVHETELTERKDARRRKQKAMAREDRMLAKKHSKSLQNYFNAQAGVRSNRQPLQTVDSQDARIFPALGVNVETDSPDTPSDSESAGFSPPGGAWGGAQISSYSSVTSNMGLFPTLGNSSNGTSEGPSQGMGIAERPGTHGHSAWSLGARSGEQDERRGKKSTRIVLSNAGPSYRR